MPSDTTVNLHRREEIKLQQIDSICQFLILDKEARVDFNRLYALDVKFTQFNYEVSTVCSTMKELADQELFRGMKELEFVLKDDIIEDLHVPIDLAFSYFEGDKLLGVLPLYSEDQVAEIY
jgi:hypothetical protein